MTGPIDDPSARPGDDDALPVEDPPRLADTPGDALGAILRAGRSVPDARLEAVRLRLARGAGGGGGGPSGAVRALLGAAGFAALVAGLVGSGLVGSGLGPGEAPRESTAAPPEAPAAPQQASPAVVASPQDSAEPHEDPAEPREEPAEAREEPAEAHEDPAEAPEASSSPPPRPLSPRAAGPDVERAPTSVPSELVLLRTARTELRAGALDAAGAALDDAERLHPGGALAEERDALRIEWLAASGRRAEASRALERFVAAHPSSPHRARLDALLGVVRGP